MEYIIIYINFCVASILSIVKSSYKIKKALEIYVLILAIFFIGTRGYVAHDWIHYKPSFEKIESIISILNGDKFYFERISYDFGYKIYMSSIKIFTTNYHLFIFISSLIDIYILRLTFKRYLKYSVLGFVFFLGYEGLKIEFDLLRNSKAIFLFIYSIKFIEEKKIKKFCLLNLLGIAFHHSAVFYFPLYFILKKKYKKKYCLIIFILLNIMYLMKIEILKPLMFFLSKILPLSERLSAKLYFYSTIGIYSRNMNFGFGYNYLSKIILFLIVIFYFEKIISQRKNNIYFLNSFFIYSFLDFLLWEFAVIHVRILTNFIYAYWFIFPILISIKMKEKSKILISVLLVLPLFNLMRTHIYHPRKNVREALKYENILLNSLEYKIKIKEMIKINNENKKIK